MLRKEYWLISRIFSLQKYIIYITLSNKATALSLPFYILLCADAQVSIVIHNSTNIISYLEAVGVRTVWHSHSLTF